MRNAQQTLISAIPSGKIQLISSLVAGFIIEVVASGLDIFPANNFLMSYATKVVLMLLLWQGAIQIFRITEKWFRWYSKDMPRVLVSVVLAYLFSFIVVTALNVGLNFYLGFDKAFIKDIFTATFIASLLLLVILSGINILSFLRLLNEKDSETTRHNYQAYFQALVDELEDVIQVVDVNGIVKFTNAAIYHLLGYTREEAQGAEAFQYIHPDDRERVTSGFRQLIAVDPTKDYEIEYRLVTKDGKIKCVATRVVHALSNPYVNGIIAMVRDITHRIESENALKQSLSLTRGIVESTAEGILVTDLHDNIILYNETFKEMWLLTEEMLQARKKSVALQHAITNVENASEVFEIISSSDEKVNERIRLVAYLKNGRVLEGISMPQRIDGKVVGRIWSNRDITDRINSEKEEIEKGVAQAQFESLKNQVNPHFLFNSLNVLSSLVHIDPDLSEHFIDELAKSYRYLLEQKDKELVPLKTEIDFANSFLFLLKIRFEEKLQTRINLPAKAMNYGIAPLTLQLLIENAVKHNIVSAEAPLQIDISIDEEDYLIVSNNIQLRTHQMPSTHVGLKNITSRYNLLTKLAPEFKVLDQKYVARIPLIKTEQNVTSSYC